MRFWIGAKVRINYQGKVGAREVIPASGTIGRIVDLGTSRGFDWLVEFDKPFVCLHGYTWESHEDHESTEVYLDDQELDYV